MNNQEYKTSIEIKENSWTEFIINSELKSPFYKLEYQLFFDKYSKYKPFKIGCINSKDEVLGALSGVIQREKKGIIGYFSSRAIIWGGPYFVKNLTESEKKQITKSLLEKLNNHLKKQCIFIEFRNLENTQYLKDIFNGFNYKYLDHLNYIVSLDSAENMLKKINSGKARQIKKSIKSGATIEVAESIEDVKSFYLILKNLYDSKVKKPLPDFSFFENFFNDKNLGKFLIIKFENKVIAGIMCPIHNNTIYEWYIANTSEKIEGVYPGVLATWAPLLYGTENNLAKFDFMGAGKPDEDYGVREFKAQFGGELVSYGRYLKINSIILYNLGKFALKVLQKIK